MTGNLTYFSSVSDNTHRFVQKLGLTAHRLPLRTSDDTLLATEPFVLITREEAKTLVSGVPRLAAA